MNRFVSFDGESINHQYVLLANDAGFCLEQKTGGRLSTDRIINSLISYHEKVKHRKYTYVAFGLNYDVEHWMRDLSEKQKIDLFYHGRVIYSNEQNHYDIRYYKKKMFVLVYTGKDEKRHKITIYDTMSFFPGNFENAIKTILGVEDEVIRQGKQSRDKFGYKDFEAIKKYNLHECKLLSRLMTELERRLIQVGITGNKWYGASAVANMVLKTWNANSEVVNLNPDYLQPIVDSAINSAYYGGRIEIVKRGTIESIYTYDINSAYPAAITTLPSCGHHWKKIDWDELSQYSYQNFSLWSIEYKHPKDTYLPVFPQRLQNGSIIYPIQGKGVYWYPEVKFFIDRYGLQNIKIKQGWIQPKSYATRLAQRIRDMYSLRQELKGKGDSTEYALKITLNSIYGKFAQSVGKPKFRNLAYAGYITSYTRSELLRAVANQEHIVIALATDAVFTTKKLSLSLSKKIGDWTENYYKQGIFIMPGLYRLRDNKGDKVASRGYGSKLDFVQIIHDLNYQGKSSVQVKEFIGYKLAYKAKKAYQTHYLQIMPKEKIINPEEVHKRKYNKVKDWNLWADSSPYLGDNKKSRAYEPDLLTEWI